MRALARLVVLVALGFGVGLAFGLVLEEPGLLARYLAGEGESVELASDAAPRGARSATGDDDAVANASAGAESRPRVSAEERAAGGALPGVAAAASSGERAASSAERATDTRRVAAANEPVSQAARPSPARRPAAQGEAAPSKRRPVPLVEKTPERGWAIQVGAFADERAAERLAEGLRSRYPVAVLPARERGGRWRVRIQPITGEGEARSMADRLKRDERLPTWVTPMETGTGS